jgi:cellulose biosynthesis protein BcsQ
MKFKVALLTADRLYGNRLLQRFQEKYSSVLEVSQFTSEESALRYLRENRTDILVYEGVQLSEPLPRGCDALWLTENGSRTLKEEPERGFLKYQRAEEIYKGILGKMNSPGPTSSGDRATGVMAFFSPVGGCGTSTAAVAAALHYARKGKQVLYLDCSPYTDTETFFPETSQGMRQLLLGLKRSAGDSVGKLLESVVSTSPEKVCYIGSTSQPEDLLSVSGDLADSFLRQTVEAGRFDWVILDLPGYPAEPILRMMQLAGYLIAVSDGSVRANLALRRYHTYLQNLDEREGLHLCRHLRLLYNRFSSRNSSEYTDTEIPGVGGFGRVESSGPMDVVRVLADQLQEKTKLDEFRPDAY